MEINWNGSTFHGFICLFAFVLLYRSLLLKYYYMKKCLAYALNINIFGVDWGPTSCEKLEKIEKAKTVTFFKSKPSSLERERKEGDGWYKKEVGFFVEERKQFLSSSNSNNALNATMTVDECTVCGKRVYAVETVSDWCMYLARWGG